MLIDFHTHCFPEKIAQTAIEKLSFAAGGLEYYTNGTTDSLKELMENEGVTASVVLNIATNAKQQTNVNNFAASINDEKTFFSFGSVFPDSPDALDELERIKSLGLKGVKLHPDYQGFSVDDPKMIPIYKKISSLGLITVFHAGFDYGFKPPFGATPDKMIKALSYFDSPVVAAHWGGINCAEDVLKHLCGENIYFDLSFGYSIMPKYYAEKIIEKHGTDKLLFGTDSPWHKASMDLRLLNTLGLSEEDLNKIKYKNACKLLSINAENT